MKEVTSVLFTQLSPNFSCKLFFKAGKPIHNWEHKNVLYSIRRLCLVYFLLGLFVVLVGVLFDWFCLVGWVLFLFVSRISDLTT